jgi:PAS domain S-box-containing protein
MKKSINKLIILSFLLLFFRNSFSQQFFVKSYTIEDGLPTRNISDACQDNEGIMWFATNFGISKYDGFRFTNYDAKSGLPNQTYRKIKVDEKGILWVMPDLKLDTIVYLKDNKWVKIVPPAKEARNYLMNSFDVIYRNNKPVICMGSFDGYYIFENDAWTHFTISDDESLNYVYTVVANGQKFYLSTKNGLCVVDNGKTDCSLNNLLKPYGTDIIAISFENRNTPDEKMWVLNEKWLGYIEHNHFRMVTNKFQLPHPSIFYYSYVNCDKKGNVFFGNIWAKYYISNTSDIPVPLMFDNGFSSHGATSVFIDREQNIWITDTRGINKINNLKVINYFKKNGMLEDEVTAIAEMNDGRIVLGHNNGLSIFNNNTFKIIEFPDLKLNTRRVSDMIKDKDGNIWFVSISRGLGKLQPGGNITWYSSDKFPVTTVVHQDKTGRIWVGADTKLLYLKNGKLTEYLPYNNKYNTIRKIFSADKGGIYITGSSGLWYIHDDKVEKIPSLPDKKANNVFAYFKSRSGVEFVGTINGLYVIENGKIVKYKNKGVEINNPIFFIFQDTDNNFWIGTNTGVYKWDGDSNIEVYNIYNGLAGWETNRAAGIADSKGRVWIGTDRGLTCFEPGYNKNIISIPDIKLLYTEDSRGIQHPLTKKSTIKYDDNTLIFHFRGISFINEDLIQYKYKLDGFDQTWQEINQSMLDNIKYIGLKPGKYTFCVMAKNFSGTWSNVSRSETIRIKSPFYFTWWFLLSALIMLSGIIYGIIRFNVQKSHNTGLEKEIIERKRIEQALIESKQKYMDLVELLPETIYEADFSGKLVYMNDTGFRLFGYQHTDLKTDILINQLVAHESQDDIHMHMEVVYEFKKSDRAIMTGITKDGTTFPLSIHTVPVINNNRCIGTRGIIINLTEQKRFEDQLQKNAEDLQALNNSKDKFFSIIAHDLRSPFTTFLGFTEILDEEIDTLPKEELHSIVTYMRTSALNLYQLLENLLEWSLLHREITKFEPQATLLFPLVQNCLDTISDSAKQKGIDVKIEISEFLKVVADIHMLQTIIRNLLSNAVKFTPRGGYVQVSANTDEEQFVTIAVKDTGIGISADMLNKIFLIDTNNKTKGTEGEVSTGLGLILCKEFVEKHGGKIWVESEEGKGSTFYFTVKSITV